MDLVDAVHELFPTHSTGIQHLQDPLHLQQLNTYHMTGALFQLKLDPSHKYFFRLQKAIKAASGIQADFVDHTPFLIYDDGR